MIYRTLQRLGKANQTSKNTGIDIYDIFYVEFSYHFQPLKEHGTGGPQLMGNQFEKMRVLKTIVTNISRKKFVLQNLQNRNKISVQYI